MPRQSRQQQSFTLLPPRQVTPSSAATSDAAPGFATTPAYASDAVIFHFRLLIAARFCRIAAIFRFFALG